MRQRVQLARGLAGAPRAVMMDEPFGALDTQTRATMQRLLIDTWRAHPTTVVFVTHDVDEAVALADRVLVLKDAQVSVDLRLTTERPRDRTSEEFASTRRRLLAELGVAEPATLTTPHGDLT
jgi:NitT/TauT family transport system ATP-binding protein